MRRDNGYFKKKEQVTICLRYVDMDQGIIREDFIGFVEAKSTTGAELQQLILSQLSSVGLSLKHLRGQGYDGGSNMSGREQGVQALILAQQPLAFYTHCFSHCLNLCLSKTCEIKQIKNMLGIVRSITTFLTASAKGVNIFQNKISESVHHSDSIKKN